MAKIFWQTRSRRSAELSSLSCNQGIFHIFLGREHRKQVKCLKDETYGSRPKVSKFIGCASTGFLVID